MSAKERGSPESVLAEARAAWPGVGLDGAEAWLRDTLGSSSEELHAVDLCLAWACARGDARAVALFQERLGPEVDAALRGQPQPSGFVDEVRQALWVRLFVHREGEKARIASYTGRGSLAAWVRVAATRLALNLRQAGRKELLGAEAVPEPPPTASRNPERAILQARYAGEFRVALEQAIAALPAEERNVLRLHFLDGLGIDAIGHVYQVHRSTVARWIARSRERLRRQTVKTLRARLRVSDSELQSLVRLVRSQLDVSLGGLLSTER